MNERVVHKYFLFLAWPFFSLFYSFFDYKSRSFRNILWLFTIFFGYTFVISNEGMDANFYRRTLEEFHNSQISWSSFMALLIEGQVGRGDYIQPIITFLVSRFTDDYRILFALFGLILGFFYASNISILLNEVDKRVPIHAIPFLIFFSLLVPFWLINGFRFWTATHVFVYGVLRFSISQGKWYILVALCSVLIHFSFIIPTGIMLGLIFFRKFGYLIMAFFALSYVFRGYDIYSFLSYLPELPAVLNQRIGDYVHPDYIDIVERGKERTVWFLRLRGLLLVNLVAFSFVVIFGFMRRAVEKYQLDLMFYLSVALFGVANILSAFPSMGRLFTVSSLLLLATVSMLCQYERNNLWLKRLCIVTLLPITFYCIIELRMGMDYMGLNTFLLNPLIAPFVENERALIELVP